MSAATVRPGPVHGRARAPPSKSYTHRALVAAHLAHRRCVIRHPLDSDDTRATAFGLARLGGRLQRDRAAWTVRVGPRPTRRVTIDCRESGTTLRFLTAVSAADGLPVRLVGRGRLPGRPMAPLLDALRDLGLHVAAERPGLGLPLRIDGALRGGPVHVAADQSSQFASALLFALPTAPEASELELVGPVVSRTYLEATEAVVRHFGVRLERDGLRYRIPGGQRYRPRAFTVPGDASSAAYLLAAAAVTGGSVEVDGLDPTWPQADLKLLEVLRDAGARVRRGGHRCRVDGAPLSAFDVDLTDAPDLFPLAGALAACARGETHLRGAPQVALKESDRRAGTIRLARELGARVAEPRGAVAISGSRRPRRLRLAGARDHRLVMSAAVAALAADGPSRIAGADCVAKSFPGFWVALRSLGAGVRVR